MRLFGKKRTRALETFPARLRRAARPALARAGAAAAEVLLREGAVGVDGARALARVVDLRRARHGPPEGRVRQQPRAVHEIDRPARVERELLGLEVVDDVPGGGEGPEARQQRPREGERRRGRPAPVRLRQYDGLPLEARRLAHLRAAVVDDVDDRVPLAPRAAQPGHARPPP